MTRKTGVKPIMLAMTLSISMAVLAMPARADHDSELLLPLATIIAAGALLNYGHASHHYHHYYHYRRYSYRSAGHSHYRGAHADHGYRKSGHYYRGQASRGGYAHRPRASKSRGAYHAPRHRH